MDDTWTQSENAAEENRRLRRTMRDLVALSTLPAVWTGLGPDGIARSLADVLLNTLSLDLIYVRLAGLTGEGRDRSRPQQAPPRRRTRRGGEGGARPAARRPTAAEPPATIPDPFGAGTLHVAVTRFGVGDDHGVLVAGSRNADFPTEQDRLLLGVGANQTAIVVQRRRAEEQVREQREWLRVTLASIGDAVIATDTEGRVTFLNAVAEALTGWTQDEAEGKPLETVFAHRQRADPPAGREPGRQGCCGRASIVGLANHTVLIAKDGTERPIDDSAAPIRDEEGEIVGCVLVFRDVTERRQADARLAGERTSLPAGRAGGERRHLGLGLGDEPGDVERGGAARLRLHRGADRGRCVVVDRPHSPGRPGSGHPRHPRASSTAAVVG